MNTNCEFIAHFRQADGIWQSVTTHLEESARICATYAGKIGLSSLGELTGLLHDNGKFGGPFQSYIRAKCGLTSLEVEHSEERFRKGEIDHSTAGAQFIWKTAQSLPPLSQLTAQIAALCIASHHSGLLDCLSPEGMDRFTARMNKDIASTCYLEAERQMNEAYVHRIQNLLDAATTELHSCVQPLFKNETSKEIRDFYLGLIARFVFSALIDADRLSTADFESPSAAQARPHGQYTCWEKLIDRMETYLGRFSNRDPIHLIRSTISTECVKAAEREKGIYMLTIPTGGGKTLSSLRFAVHHARHNRMDRIIYVIPYTSIIDQNAKVIREVLENKDADMDHMQIVLEHHSNLTQENDTWKNRILSENWDAPIVCTTAVQFLETLFAAGTRGARRTHQLANAVVIFDEIQTIPIKTIHLFNNAINFLMRRCGSSIVFCTATQPILDKVDSKKGAVSVSPNPELVHDHPKYFRRFQELRRIEVIDRRKAGGWRAEEIADLAVQETNAAGSVLIIVNTKAHAKALFNICRQKMEGVIHLSTNMCPAHRMDRLNEIKDYLHSASSRPLICISTQLIEAGVDIDFACVIRCLAGIDSIAQAAGRCNRSALRPGGKVYIIDPSDENLQRLPEIRQAQEIAERIMDEYRDDPSAFDFDLIGPQTIAQYYRYYYFNRAKEMTYPLPAQRIGRDDSLFSLLSSNSLSVEEYKRCHQESPPIILRQSFKTAAQEFAVIDAPTEGIIVPYSDRGKAIIAALSATDNVHEQSELLKEAQRYSVNVFPTAKKILSEKGCIYEVQQGIGIMYLDDRFYSPDFGVTTNTDKELEPLFA